MLQSSIVYHQDPLISYYKNVASADECQQLIDLATGKLVPSVVASHNAVGLSQSRISEQASFEHASSEIVRRVTSRIADIVCQPLSRAEPVQIVRYPFGGKFDPHYDTFDPVSTTGQQSLQTAGQRLYTAILYLNSVQLGGETFFPFLNLHLPPVRGDLLVFQNCKNDSSEAHPFSMHGGHPVVEGEKWIATLWFRERSYD